MMAGGISFPTVLFPVGDNCIGVRSRLFDDFKFLGSQSGTSKALELASGKKVNLFHQNFGSNLESYSRQGQTGDGKWVTVQARKWSGKLIDIFTIDVFDGQGNTIARVNDDDCGALMISKTDYENGLDVVIRSALFAVTGRHYVVGTRD